MASHLIGTSEIAHALGVSRQRVDELARTDPTFPEPEVRLAAGRIWLRKDVERWAKATGRELK